MTYRERIEKTKEDAFLTGINGLKPKDKLPMMYNDSKYKSSDNYLRMIYAYEYYHGQDERRDRTGERTEPVDPRKPLVMNMVKKAEIAFQYGVEAREHSIYPLWLTDQRLIEMLNEMGNENESMNMLDAYLAGFHLADEETPREVTHGLDTCRMLGIREAYVSGEEPELGTEASKAYDSYCQCLELLDFQGCDHFVPCITCEMPYRLKDKRLDQLQIEDPEGCPKDCELANRCLSEVCYDQMKVFESYFIIPKEART